MKKLLFSAVALVAFSGVSMANTIETMSNVINFEHIISFENQKDYSSFISPWHLPQELIDKIVECAKVSQEIRESYSTYPNQDTVNDIAAGAFFGCMQ